MVLKFDIQINVQADHYPEPFIDSDTDWRGRLALAT